MEKDLNNLLQQRLSPEDYGFYQELHDYHFWQWKMHRVCDESSLRGLRYFLYRSGVLTITRRAVEPNHETKPAFGTFRRDEQELFSGLENPLQSRRRDFFEPGDCLELYENARPGWVMHGLGKHLTYSIEQTLLNCLREPLRGDRTGSARPYQCPTFYDVLKQLELCSVGDFVLQMRAGDGDESDGRGIAPFSILSDAFSQHGSGLTWKSLTEAHENARAFLDANRPQIMKLNDALTFATMLGFLIDELITRVAVPNGMGHWYGSTFAVLSALKAKFGSLRESMTTNGTNANELERVIDSLVSQSGKFNSTGASALLLDDNWLRLAEDAADQLRSLSFAGRKRKQMDDKVADLVFSASNAIWRWIFFLEQANAPEGPSPSLRPEYRNPKVELISRWIRRPWGIVTAADIKRAFRGIVAGDQHDEMTRAFSVLTPIFQVEIEEHLKGAFGVSTPQRASDLVRRFISCRLTLYLLRQLTRRIQHEHAEDDDRWFRAHGLIDLLLMWVYGREGGELERIGSDIAQLPRILRSGQWLRELLKSHGDGGIYITPRQSVIVTDYLRDPELYISGLFLVHEPNFLMEEMIGMFPPESFSFQPRARQGRSSIR